MMRAMAKVASRMPNRTGMELSRRRTTKRSMVGGCAGGRPAPAPAVTVVSALALGGRRVEEPAEEGLEVGEQPVPADVQRVGGVPLDPVAGHHVAGVEARAVVERH